VLGCKCNCLMTLRGHPPGIAPFLTPNPGFLPGFGPSGAATCPFSLALRTPTLSRTKHEEERRRWPRLPLAIPIFVRSRDEKGKDLLEFATAMNVSAGGVLVAVRRSLPLAERVSLEIPTAPSLALNAGAQASRLLQARTVRVIHGEGYHLIGLKFSQPLGNHKAQSGNGRRKLPTPM